MSSIVFPGGVGTPTFDEAAHAYTFEGKSVPSVTQVMRPITQLAYGAIPLEVLRKAAAFGTAVHACTELYDQDDLDPFSVEDDWLPYMAGVSVAEFITVRFQRAFLGVSADEDDEFQ